MTDVGQSVRPGVEPLHGKAKESFLWGGGGDMPTRSLLESFKYYILFIVIHSIYFPSSFETLRATQFIKFIKFLYVRLHIDLISILGIL
jgi:hypothetical protein